MKSQYSEKTRQSAIDQYRGKGRDKKKIPAEQIAKQPGMPNVKTILKWLRDAGVKIRPPKRRYPREKILKMLNAKPPVPRAKIRAKYGCSEKYLSNLANGKLDT